MRRSQKPLEERLRNAEKKRRLDAFREEEDIEKTNNSILGRISKPVRIVFYFQVLVSILGFIFHPIQTKEKIKFYLYEVHTFKGFKFYTRIIKTDNTDYALCSFRIKNSALSLGDSIIVSKNLFFKTECVSKNGNSDTFYTSSKFVWCFIWIFAFPTALISSFFKSSRDLRIRNRFTLGLLVIILFYFLF